MHMPTPTFFMNYQMMRQMQHGNGFVWFLFWTGLVFWLVTLVLALRNRQLSDVSRFMWVFVAITVPVLGGLLYLIMAPSNEESGNVELSAAEAHRRTYGLPEKQKWENR